MCDYDNFNREERAMCAHLFRLLHEKLDDIDKSPLKQFVEYLSHSELHFENGKVDLKTLKYENVKIFSEVSIIRDKFDDLKPNTNQFIDKIIEIIKEQKGLNCTIPPELKLHPAQVLAKDKELYNNLKEDQRTVFDSLKGLFYTKPDLAITIDNLLLVCEAKFTLPFDNKQIESTRNIAEIWAKVLYKELGFESPPVFCVFKLGHNRHNEKNITWENILKIAQKYYSERDRTRKVLEAGVRLLNR
jgi:hypothetical protein